MTALFMIIKYRSNTAHQQAAGCPQCCRVRRMWFRLKGKGDPPFATWMDLRDRMLCDKPSTKGRCYPISLTWVLKFIGFTVE